MDWLHHPKFLDVRDDVIRRFRAQQVSFRKLEHVVFLCGGFQSERRKRLAEYLKRQRMDTLVFYADNVWQHIATKESLSGNGLNALDMEAELARLADMVIIVVESPGTFAELGAFSLSDELRRKLLPILDKSFRGAESFINTGPIRWVDKDSRFAPSIYTDFKVLLDSAAEVDERIDRLPQVGRTKVANVRSSGKHLTFFLCDLVAVLGPVKASQLGYFTDEILGTGGGADVIQQLGVAVALDLLRTINFAGETFYLPVPTVNYRPYTRRKLFDVWVERSKVLSKLQQIDEARAILQQI